MLVHAWLLSITFVLLCYMLCFSQITLFIICFNIYVILHLYYCLALCCYFPTECSRKSRPDSGPEPSRVVVRISCAYSRSSNLIPFSSSGFWDPRGFTINRMNTTWIDRILRMNCLVKHSFLGEIQLNP